MTRWGCLCFLVVSELCAADADYLQWDAKQAKSIVHANRFSGQVGKSFDFRVTATDRSYNFKLRATWMTPATIQALARIEQIEKALSADDTRKLVEVAMSAGEIIIQIEIDPREGSGVIPSDWVALLGPRSYPSSSPPVVRGSSLPRLRQLPALAPISPRDYSYEIFWLVFPSKGDDGRPLFSDSDREAELTVRIHGKLGKVRWPTPAYLSRN